MSENSETRSTKKVRVKKAREKKIQVRVKELGLIRLISQLKFLDSFHLPHSVTILSPV